MFTSSSHKEKTTYVKLEKVRDETVIGVFNRLFILSK